MNKIFVALSVLSLAMTAQAEVIHLRVTTHLQDGVHFPELDQCFLSASDPRAATGENVILKLQSLGGENLVGYWERKTRVDDKTFTYRLSASRSRKAGAALKLRAQILVGGVVQNAGLLDLAGDDQWGFPVNSLEATTVGGQATCQTANITVVQVEERSMSIAQDSR